MTQERRPPLYVINELLNAGAEICAHDPVAFDGASKKSIPSGVKKARVSYEACEGADALFISTEWNEYRQPDFGKLLYLMKSPVIVDGRNMYSPRAMKNMGFRYFCVGEP